MQQTNISESQLQPEPLSESMETFSSTPRDSLSAQLPPKPLLSIISTPLQQLFLSIRTMPLPSRLLQQSLLYFPSIRTDREPPLPSIQALQSTEELLNTIRLRGSLQLILFPPVRWRSLMIQEFFHGWICQALRLRQVL